MRNYANQLNKLVVLLLLLLAATTTYGQAVVLSPTKMVGPSSHAQSATTVGWQWQQDNVNGISISCATGTTTCIGDFPSTPAGLAGVIFIDVGNTTSNPLVSVSGGGTWTVQSNCTKFGSSTAGTMGCAFNPSITTGTTQFTITVTNNSANFIGFEFFGLFPPAGATPSVAATNTSFSSSSSTSCTGLGFTTSGTDMIIQWAQDSGGSFSGLGYNLWTGSYFTDIFANGIFLNASGTISAPTLTQSSAYCFIGAIDLTSTAGTFTPTAPSKVQSLISVSVPGTSACNTTCSPTITSTAAGDLLVYVASDAAGKTIASISDSADTFTACSGFNITITSTNDTNSCAYTLSVSAGKTAPTVTMSGNSSTTFMVYEVHGAGGCTWSADTQNSGQVSSASIGIGFFNGQALTLTGANDTIIQATYNPGGPFGATLYPLPYGSNNLATTNASSQIRLNTTDGSAPVWGTNQIVNSSVSGVAFTCQ